MALESAVGAVEAFGEGADPLAVNASAVLPDDKVAAAAAAWLAVSDTLSSTSGTHTTVFGRAHASADCVAKAALLLPPTTASAAVWVRLGVALLRGGGKFADAAMPALDATACFTRALELDRRCASAWHHLGTALGDTSAHLLDGSVVDARRCLAAAAELLPRHAPTWYNLAHTLVPPHDTVRLDRAIIGPVQDDDVPPESTPVTVATHSRPTSAAVRCVGRRYCFARAASLQPELPGVWTLLAQSLPPGGVVTLRPEGLRGRLKCGPCPSDGVFSAEACYHEAIAQDAGDAEAWLGLGVERVATDAADAISCFAGALALDDTLQLAWGHLGAALAPGVTVDVGGTDELSSVQCLARAVELDASDAVSWCNLAVRLMAEGEATGATAGEGPQRSAQQTPTTSPTMCLQRALTVDSSQALPWYHLGSLLLLRRRNGVQNDRDTTYAINALLNSVKGDHSGGGTLATRCLRASVELDPSSQRAWCNLGTALAGAGAATAVTVKGETFSAEQCFARGGRTTGTGGAPPTAATNVE